MADGDYVNVDQAPRAQFVECEALLAIMNGDREEAERLLEDSFDSELLRLSDHAKFLSDVCAAMLRSRAYARRQAEVAAATAERNARKARVAS